MAEVKNNNKTVYMVVVDEDEQRREKESFRYTRSVLQSTLHLMGCKPRHAFKISKSVFGNITSQISKDAVISSSVTELKTLDLLSMNTGLMLPEANASLVQAKDRVSKNSSSECRRRKTVSINRDKFLDIVCDALAEYKYMGPNQKADLNVACRIRERKESVTVLLCGTSGCGKSTLSSLLASRLGITTVVSTDSIRHMMRSFVDEKQNPLLWASTYHAGECLDPVAVAESELRKKARRKAGMLHSFPKDRLSDCIWNEKPEIAHQGKVSNNVQQISEKELAVAGYRAQSEMVIESLDRLITAWEERKESVIVEGVHLSLNFVMGLMKKHPSIIPFMIYITDEDKHVERFAVRAKYMTLDPTRNKYVKYIRNIRRIQEYLCKRADKHLVPKINNTNVDRSVAGIHATLFSCLRRRVAGEKLYDPITNTVTAVYEEYRNQCAADSWSSKGMFQLIQRKGSSRRMMAFVNDDGSITKAWSVGTTNSVDEPICEHSTENMIGTPMCRFLQIGSVEQINLHFGNLGISAWPSDTGGTSYTSSVASVDDSMVDLTGIEGSGRSYSSCCSSPQMFTRPTKRHKEELSVSGSDEEADDQPEKNSDEDFSDDNKHNHHEEMEGSIDEGSVKSDEEYDDLAMQDEHENGYWSDKEYDFRDDLSNFPDQVLTKA